MQGSPTIEYHKTRDFGKKLNATIEFIKENFKPLFKAMLFISGPPIVLGSILMTQVFEGFMGFASLASVGVEPGFEEFSGMVLPILGGTIFLLIGGTAIVAVIYDYMILYEKQGKDISVNDVWQLTKRSFWQVLGRMFLLALLIIAAYVLLVLVIVLFAVASGVLAFLMGSAIVVAFIYFLIPLYLIFIITAYEKVDFGTGLKKCFKLIKEKWWSTFGLVFVAGLIQGVISSIFLVPWYIIFAIKTLHTTDPTSFSEPSVVVNILSTISFLAYSILRYLLLCIPLIAIAFQYFNLIELKESKGLMAKIDSFGTTSTTEDEEEHY